MATTTPQQPDRQPTEPTVATITDTARRLGLAVSHMHEVARWHMEIARARDTLREIRGGIYVWRHEAKSLTVGMGTHLTTTIEDTYATAAQGLDAAYRALGEELEWIELGDPDVIAERLKGVPL